MATPVGQNYLPPAGVFGEYFGAAGGTTTRYYWVQTLYAGGKSALQRSNAVASTVASLDRNNFVNITWTPMGGAIGYLVYYTTTTAFPIAGAILVATVTAPNFTDYGQSNSGTIQTSVVGFSPLLSFAARYDFAVDGGGAPGLITLANSDTIPANTIIYGGIINVITALTGATATIAVGTSAGSAANALKTATAVATYASNALLPVVPVMTAGTALKLTADGTITITTATAALTGGTMDIRLFGYQGYLAS